MFDSLVVRARLYRSARMQHPHRRAVACALVALTLLGCETVGWQIRRRVCPGGDRGAVDRHLSRRPHERSGQPMPYTPNMVVWEGDRIRRDPARMPRLTLTMATLCT
jgi:hypothetical protein